MEPFFRDFATRLSILHDGLDASLVGLSSEALDYVPGPEMNSLAVLATHVAAAERYWIAAVAGGEPTDRVRETEFRVQDQDVDTLRTLLRDTLVHSQSVLARLHTNDLGKACRSPRHDEPYTMANALLHALDHTAEHMGHMQMVRQLWEQHRAG